MNRLQALVFCSLTVAAASVRAAYTYTWNNPEGGDLHDSANYTPGNPTWPALPNGNSTVAYNLDATYTITAEADSTASQGVQTFNAGNITLGLNEHVWNLYSTALTFANAKGSPFVTLASGQLTGCTMLTVGDTAGTDHYAAFVLDGTDASLTMNNKLIVGSKGCDNVCVVTNGAKITGVHSIVVGNDAAASRNILHVSGEGSQVSATTAATTIGGGTGNVIRVTDKAYVKVKGVTVGSNASSWGSRLEVEDGAMLDCLSQALTVGSAGGGSTVTVDAASVTNVNGVRVGIGSSNNRLQILNGAELHNNSSCAIGLNGNAGTNNTVLVSGAGSKFINKTYNLEWDSKASNSVVRVEDGALADFNKFIYIGTGTAGSDNALILSNGTARVCYAITVKGGSLLEISGHGALAEVHSSSKDYSTVYAGATLRFVSDSEGFGKWTSTFSIGAQDGAKIEIDARKVAKAGGGTFTLIETPNKPFSLSDQVLSDLTVMPENCTVTAEGHALTVTVPPPKNGLMLLIR